MYEVHPDGNGNWKVYRDVDGGVPELVGTFAKKADAELLQEAYWYRQMRNDFMSFFDCSNCQHEMVIKAELRRSDVDQMITLHEHCPQCNTKNSRDHVIPKKDFGRESALAAEAQ